MKSLNKHVIIYDDQCPLCNLYTGAFVKTGMLDADGREAYSCMQPQTATLLDLDRARNEIALVDHQSQSVTYGIDSLFKIIGHRFPLLKPLFAWVPFRWLMGKAYAFVSYNRKVIIPGSVLNGPGTCTPDLNLKYRWAYIVFAWLVSAWVLNTYARLLTPLIPPSNFTREFLICGGQILFQAAAVSLLRKDRLIHYLGNMMTVSLAGALLLMPPLLLPHLSLPHAPFVYAGYFILVVGLMFLEHSRRVKRLHISFLATGSWVLYRLLVLLIIL